MIKNYKNEDFIELTSNTKIVVEFYSDFVSPLNKTVDIINQNDVDVLKVDVNKYPELTKRYNIKTVPTYLLFNDNSIQNRINGINSEDTIINFLK